SSMSVSPPPSSPVMPPLPPVAAERLGAFLNYIRELSPSLVGYPCSQDYDYSEITPFLNYALNNIGDPFADSYFRQNTYPFEREVIEFFQKHLRAPAGQTWGYMTAGGTEGNLYGLYLAREMFPTGMIYYSEHTHYSAAKIVRVLGARSIMIRGQENGEIDYEDLREMLKLNRDVPPIIFANIGNTMHGAIDDIPHIRGMMKEMAISRHYIHADAALSGMILPWVESPQAFGFDEGIDSVAVSGHKFIGSPIPCGIVLARRSHVDRVARGVEYVGCMDTTIAGSRNSITPLIMWIAIQRWGEEGFRKRVAACIAMADYAIERFAALGVKAWRHWNSVTVVFPNPGPEVISRWQMAPSGNVAHIITMPHITAETIDRVTADVAAALQPKA
ncbi:MAG TPA: histidine decarboxylase, partial [Verrucomicrobiales bacterium]|nr:histidine decarboxylase [Verrucomicrobiales bacterium]